MKKIILLGLVLCSCHTIAKVQPLDITPYVQDRFEKDCAFKQAYDLLGKDGVFIKKILPHVGEGEFSEEQAYSAETYPLKNVTYRGVPVKKIDYSYGRMAKQYNETLYFDLSTSLAKQNFAKIKFRTKQAKEYTGLDIRREGKYTLVQCYWADPEFLNY